MRSKIISVFVCLLQGGHRGVDGDSGGVAV